MVAGMPDQPELALLEARPMINDQPTAYVCRHFVCKLRSPRSTNSPPSCRARPQQLQEWLAASVAIARAANQIVIMAIAT